jgi:muramoyltetrapeptide carboxypeptidase LdcA involved in peptidoglycan recycling
MSFIPKISKLLLTIPLTLSLFISLPAPSSEEIELKEDKVVISLVAPSREVNDDVVTVFRAALKDQGCLTLLPEHYQDTKKAPYGYHSESDKVRARLFTTAHNEESQVIWALRGGYGTQAVTRALKTAPIEYSTPKILVGFSDFTLLGLYCHSTF